MVVFEVTPSIARLIDSAGLNDQCVKYSKSRRTVSHITLVQALRSTKDVKCFKDLVTGGRFFRCDEDASHAYADPPPRNRELEARLTALRARNEEMAYSRLVRDIAPSSGTNAQIESARLGRVGAQMSIGANVLITMATCFTAGYFVFKHSSGKESVGLVGGVICMILALCVEATLVITRMYAIDAAAEKERAAEERRAISSRAT